MTTHTDVATESADIVVVGSGIAGLVCALTLAPRPVTLITKTPGLAGGSSFWAKGGIAAALGPDDSPVKHAKDTLLAGAGLSDPSRALGLAEDGVESLKLLIDQGIPFDRALDGTLQFAREAAHRHARVVHAGGDATGEVLIRSLIERVRKTPSIRIAENTFAYDLVISANKIEGLLTLGPINGWTVHRTSRVVLATGGIGMIWWDTTNPKESTGDGLAMAARAGAKLTDLEFMQFHPTSLVADANGDGTSKSLLTEALRGAGALLLDESGNRFMCAEHPSIELAPRDVVARAIQQRTASGQAVFLDLRPVIKSGKAPMFPQAFAAAADAGLDPVVEPLPIVPAAHYHMGGVQTDQAGRTSVAGLWACGEVATTGIHGANRLASNSLLEGLVYARRVATDVLDCRAYDNHETIRVPRLPTITDDSAATALIFDAARKAMSKYVGITRTANGLETARSLLSDLSRKVLRFNRADANRFALSYEASVQWCETRNVILVARLVTLAALQREESRGAHYRDDYPRVSKTWQRRLDITIDSLGSAA